MAYQDIISRFAQPITPMMTPVEAQTSALNLRNQMQNTQLNQMRIQAGQNEIRNQMLMSNLAADPKNIDTETGTFTPEAISTVQDPSLRQRLQQGRMESQKLRAETNIKMSEEAQKSEKLKTDTLKPIYEQAYSAYENVLKKGGNKQQAKDAANKIQMAGYEEIKKTGKGGFNPDTQFKVLDPETEVGPLLISHEERMKNLKGEETSFTKEQRHRDELSSQLAELPPNSPMAPQLRKNISELDRHIARLDSATAAQQLAAPAAPKSAEGKTGDDFIKELPKEKQGTVRAIGEGRETFASLGIRGKEREKYVQLVNQAYPGYNEQDVKTNQVILNDFAKGKPAQSLQSINAVTEHMETYRKLAKALDNGDVQLYNKYKNAFERASGKTLPNDINAAAPIIGSEIVKAIVPGGGGVEERAAAQRQWSDALSNRQVESQIDNVFIPLMQGQASALKQRYEITGRKDFEKRFLTPAARKSLKMEIAEEKKTTSQDSEAVSWAKANPTDPRAIRIMEHNRGL